MPVYLRNRISGKVLTQEEWQHSENEWEDEGGSSEPDSLFVEVVKDKEGSWVEKGKE